MNRTSTLLAATTFLAASAAFPCSFVQPGPWGLTQPGEGAADVPLNTVLTLFTSPTRQFGSVAAELVDLETDERRSLSVDKEFDTVLVDLEGVIEAGKSYRVEFPPTDDFTPEREPVAFTAGDIVDTTAPEVEPTLTYDVTFRTDPANGASSCGSIPDQWIVRVNMPAAEDDVLVAGARLLIVDENGGRREVNTNRYAESGIIEHRALEGGVDTYVVEVFDLAGNVASTEEIEINRGGYMGLGGGCAAVHHRTGAAFSGAFALFGLLLVGFRRRS